MSGPSRDELWKHLGDVSGSQPSCTHHTTNPLFWPVPPSPSYSASDSLADGRWLLLVGLEDRTVTFSPLHHNPETKGPVGPRFPVVRGRIYLTSFAFIRTGGKMLQSQAASMTRSSRLLLAICCATNILKEKRDWEKAHPSHCSTRAAAPASPGPQQRNPRKTEIFGNQMSAESGRDPYA